MWYGMTAMKKRVLTIFAVLALLAGMLSGCKQPETEPSPEIEITPDPHEGQVEVTDGAGGTIWVDAAKEAVPFTFDRYSFSVSDGRVDYLKDGLTLMHGVDVSEYQHEIDWQAVADAGIEFAIIRVGWRGFSGGSINEDEMFRQNIEGAQAAGLKVGAYFFSQAVNVMEAAEEAVFTAGLLEGYSLDLPVFFDWETIGTEPARTDDVDAETVTEACLEFCKLLESVGITAGVYTYIPSVYYKYDMDAIKDLTIWMGDPGTWPEYYYEHQIWQYSFTGSVSGIEGDVDLDVIYIADPTANTEAAE